MEIHYDEDNCQFVSTEKILPRVIKVEEGNCLLCTRKRKFYCCATCVVDGNPNFLTQVSVNNEQNGGARRFPGVISGLTRERISLLKQERQKLLELEKKAMEAASLYQKRNQQATLIYVAKKRIKALRQVCNMQSEKASNLNHQRKVVESSIEQLKRRIQRAKLKNASVTGYMATKKIVMKKDSVSSIKRKKDLEKSRIWQIQDLVTYIFPLVGIQQDKTYDSEQSSDEENEAGREPNLIETELAEARRLSYVHGRWIYDQRQGPDLVRISISSSRVCAPADGNYSACEDWLKSQLFSASASDSPNAISTISSSVVARFSEPHKSRGASIYAALCLASHLMYTARKVLYLSLPYKLHYKSFSNPNMTVQEFLWNVHKLNGNVLALCLRYGVQPQLIHPLHTLPNIQNAVQMFLHNGESESPSVLTPELILSLEEALDESSDPIPDDDEDKLEHALSEWEMSLHEEDWDSLVPQPSEQAQQQYFSTAPFRSQALQDVMGQSQGLVSSAVSWVTKGWWGNR